MPKSDGICEICGHHVAFLQKAHIVAEGGKTQLNILRICPSCHVNFDTHLKPRLYAALRKFRSQFLPKSWKKSLYEQSKERLHGNDKSERRK